METIISIVLRILAVEDAASQLVAWRLRLEELELDVINSEGSNVWTTDLQSKLDKINKE